MTLILGSGSQVVFDTEKQIVTQRNEPYFRVGV